MIPDIKHENIAVPIAFLQLKSVDIDYLQSGYKLVYYYVASICYLIIGAPRIMHNKWNRTKLTAMATHDLRSLERT